MKIDPQIRLVDPAVAAKYSVYPLADLYDRLSDDKLQGLADSIRDHKQKHPVYTYRNQIVDGRNRVAACQVLGIKVRVRKIIEATPAELDALVVAENIHRRSESPIEKAHIALKHRELAELDVTDEQLAKMYGISRRTIATAKKSLQAPVPRVTIPIDRPKPIDEMRKLLTSAGRLPPGEQRDAAMRAIARCRDQLAKVLAS